MSALELADAALAAAMHMQGKEMQGKEGQGEETQGEETRGEETRGEPSSADAAISHNAPTASDDLTDAREVVVKRFKDEVLKRLDEEGGALSRSDGDGAADGGREGAADQLQQAADAEGYAGTQVSKAKTSSLRFGKTKRRGEPLASRPSWEDGEE